MGIYKNGNNKNFYYSFQYKGKRYQGSTGTSDNDKAFQFYLDIKSKVTKNKLHFIDKTFKELANCYINDYGKNDQAIIRKFIDLIGKEKLADITGHDIAKLQIYRGYRVKGSTLNRQFGILRSLFNKAVIELNWISEVPKWKKAKVISTQAKILSPEDEQRFLAELPLHLRRLTIFALETGLRKGTICQLQYHMYDFENRLLTIPPEIQKHPKEHTIPISKKAHEMIMLSEKMQPRGLGLRQYIHGNYIFTYQGKRILEPCSSAWKKAKKRANVKIRFHDLRHTWATRAIEKGLPIAYVQYLGTWSSPKMMQRYVSVNPRNLVGLDKFGY